MASRVRDVVTTLYEDIVLGVYAAGTQLVEERLAERFGVKRHTIREAFVHLEELSFVQREPSRGVFVKELTPEEVREIYDVRYILETSAVRLTPLPAPREIVDRMVEIQRLHEQAIEANRYRAVLHLNNEFHRVQFSACQNKTLVEAIEEYARRVHVVTAIKFGDPHSMAQVVRQHWEIIETMRGHDTQALVEIVSAHFSNRQCDEYERRYLIKYGADGAGTAVTTP